LRPVGGANHQKDGFTYMLMDTVRFDMLIPYEIKGFCELEYLTIRFANNDPKHGVIAQGEDNGLALIVSGNSKII
jgi:hypothetical protein